MTDEQMDARLRRAGETWRASSDMTAAPGAGPAPESLTIAAGKRRPARHTGLLASAAVIAAALVAGGAVLIANLTGNGKDSSAGAPPLKGTVWRFVGMSGDQQQQNSSSTLYIGSDGELVADDECEVIGAHVDVGGARLTLSELDVRYKDCVDSYEPSFYRALDVLRSSPRYSLDGAELTISGASKSLDFVAAPELAVPSLDIPTFLGARWRLTQVTDGQGVERPVSGDLTLHVQNGTLTASDGCGTLTGPVTMSGQQIDVTKVTIPKDDCGQSAAGVVDGVFAGPTVHQQVRGTQLTVARSGAGQLTYTWVPEDANAVDPHRLAGSDWRLASMAGERVSAELPLTIGGVSGSLSYDEGCGWNGGDVQIGVGVLRVTGLRAQPLSSCSSDQAHRATTLESFFASDPVLWRIEDGKLVIYGGGAQAFSLVYEREAAPAPTGLPLAGTNWHLAAITDANGTDVPVAGDAALLIDDAHHVSGSDGCNHISGDVTVGTSTIDFGSGLATTEMACPDEQIMNTADHVDGMLSGEVTWRIDGDELSLTKEGAGALIYQRSDRTATSPLVGRTWILNGIEHESAGGGAASGSSSMRNISVTFDGAGHVTIKHRCYVDKGDVRIDSSTLDITRVTLETAIPCPSPTDPDEDRNNATVDHVLAGTVQWQVTGGQLHLTKGSTTLDLTDAGPSEQQQPQLSGTVWKLIQDSRVTLVFDGRLDYRLRTGCHTYTGRAKVALGTMSLYDQRDLGGEDCLNTAAQKVKTFLAHGEARWSITEDALVLGKDGTEIEFSAK